MIGSTRQIRAFAFGRPVDMRKGFEGLAALIRDELGEEVLSSDLYLFGTFALRRDPKQGLKS